MSAVLYFAWHFMQCEVPMVPCRLTMTLLLLPAFSWSASKFCVASSVSSPACSSLTSALCAVPGCAFHTGDSFCQRQEYSRSSLLATRRCRTRSFARDVWSRRRPGRGSQGCLRTWRCLRPSILRFFCSYLHTYHRAVSSVCVFFGFPTVFGNRCRLTTRP